MCNIYVYISQALEHSFFGISAGQHHVSITSTLQHHELAIQLTAYSMLLWFQSAVLRLCCLSSSASQIGKPDCLQ